MPLAASKPNKLKIHLTNPPLQIRHPVLSCPVPFLSQSAISSGTENVKDYLQRRFSLIDQETQKGHFSPEITEPLGTLWEKKKPPSQELSGFYLEY